MKNIKTILTVSISLILILHFIFTPDLEGDCEKLNLMYQNQECISVVSELPASGPYFSMKNGYNPFTKKKCECEDNGRLWANYIEEIEIGDTIIKQKGELVFYIHKKDTIITHYLVCDGKVYK